MGTKINLALASIMIMYKSHIITRMDTSLRKAQPSLVTQLSPINRPSATRATGCQLLVQELVDDIVTAGGVVVRIEAMSRVGLDVRFEILGQDLGEVLLRGCWDGCEGRVARVQAIAAAVGEVVCCEWR